MRQDLDIWLEGRNWRVGQELFSLFFPVYLRTCDHSIQHLFYASILQRPCLRLPSIIYLGKRPPSLLLGIRMSYRLPGK